MEKREESSKKTIESITTTMTRRRPWEDLPYHLLELLLKPISEPIDRPALSRVCKARRDFKPLQSPCFPALVHGPTISEFIQGVDHIRTCLGSSHVMAYGMSLAYIKKAVQLVLQTRERYAAEKIANFVLSEARTLRTKDNTSVFYLDFDNTYL